MEEELVQLGTLDAEEMRSEIPEDEMIAGKKHGSDEDGIIAVLQG